jgi:ABC-type amino acid transport substrate-binding protein
MSNRNFMKLFLVFMLSVVGIIGCSSQEKTSGNASSSNNGSSKQLKTIEPGFLTVAIIGDMPMTAVENGKLIGTDGELVNAVADKLNLKVKPLIMQWPAPLEAVRSGRADIAIGNIFWNTERSKVMKMTDPLYYSSTMIIQQQDKKDVKTFDDLKGLRIGTVTGMIFVPDLQKLQQDGKIAGLSTYKDNNALIQDIRLGRVDVGFVDPPTGAYALQKNSQLKLKLVSFNENNAEKGKYPYLGGKFQTAWCITPDENELYDSINKQVQVMWKTGLNKQILSKYGLNQDAWFIPQGNPRADVDRPASWQPPTLQK